MTKEETRSNILRLIQLSRPHAKFMKIFHSSEFTSHSLSKVLKEYYLVSLYDENINLNYIHFNGSDHVVVDNTYLASFVHNLISTQIYSGHYEENPDILFKYNLKKFFAEQLYRAHDCIFSRTLLLENFLYEQKHMFSVFDRLNANEARFPAFALTSSIPSTLLGFHELGHIYSNHDSKYWEQFYTSTFFNEIKDYYGSIEARYSNAEVLEYKCDLFGFYYCIETHKELHSLSLVLKTIYFSSCCIEVFYHLQSSAKKTAIILKNDFPNETVDFKSMAEDKVQYTFDIEFDQEMAKRHTELRELCMLYAKVKEIDIFDNKPDFPFDADLYQKFIGMVNSFLDDYHPQEHALARLVARSLHGHPEGMEFLYLNSKQYNQGEGRVFSTE